MKDNIVREIRIAPDDKAYVRNGQWERVNWREINSRLGIDTNNAEPLHLKNAPAETNYGREILMTFSIEKFKSFDYKHIFLFPSFTAVDSSKQNRFDLLLVDPDSWNGDTVTWENKPVYGEAICRDTIVGGMSRAEITEAVTKQLNEGKNSISFAVVITTEGGEYNNCINPKTARLVATNQSEASLFSKTLCENEQENEELLDKYGLAVNRKYNY